MAIRIQPSRPYYPRYYLPRGARTAAAPAAARGGGGRAAPGGAIDSSSTGNVGGDLVKAIMNARQVSQQNAAANQLLNTQTPPRAAWAGGTAPAANVPLGGTAPQTGGTGELQMRQQQQQQDLADQLQKAKIAAELALVQQRGRAGRGGGGGAQGGNAARWQQYLGGGGQGGQGKAWKPPPYQIGSDANTNLDADKFQNVQADFDAQYGKGSYAKVAPRLSNVQPDDKGNYVVQDDKGNTLLNLPPVDANYWLARMNAARVRAGQQPLLSKTFPSTNPNSGQDAGTVANPYKPTNQLEARSLPYNSYFVDPDTGQVGKKGPPSQSTQPPPADQGPQKTSATDQGNQGDQVAQQAPPPEQTDEEADQEADQGDQADQNEQVAMNRPAPPDMVAGVGTDTTGAPVPDTGSQDLADAIQRAKAQNQLMAA